MTVSAEITRKKVGEFIMNPTPIETTTTAVFEDEPCFYLGEFNVMSRDYAGNKRMQILKIVRGDSLVTAYIDLGPSKNFKADTFQMVGGVMNGKKGQAFHTVKELQEGAEELRTRKLHRNHTPLDFQRLYNEHVEEGKRWQRRSSTFGSHVKIERNI